MTQTKKSSTSKSKTSKKKAIKLTPLKDLMAEAETPPKSKSTKKEKSTPLLESYEKAISLLRPTKGVLQRRQVAQEAQKTILRLKSADRMWFFRTQVANMGIGRWNDMPRPLQKFVTQWAEDRILDNEWVEVQTKVNFLYDRTWSVTAVARALLMRAAFEALLKVGEIHGAIDSTSACVQSEADAST